MRPLCHHAERELGRDFVCTAQAASCAATPLATHPPPSFFRHTYTHTHTHTHTHFHGRRVDGAARPPVRRPSAFGARRSHTVVALLTASRHPVFWPRGQPWGIAPLQRTVTTHKHHRVQREMVAAEQPRISCCHRSGCLFECVSTGTHTLLPAPLPYLPAPVSPLFFVFLCFSPPSARASLSPPSPSFPPQRAAMKSLSSGRRGKGDRHTPTKEDGESDTGSSPPTRPADPNHGRGGALSRDLPRTLAP
jgi:hypothetical protein